MLCATNDNMECSIQKYETSKLQAWNGGKDRKYKMANYNHLKTHQNPNWLIEIKEGKEHVQRW